MIFPKHIPSAMRLAAMASLSLVASLLLAGCTDGVLYEMKRMNPYYQREWKKDRELGTTFVQRVDELNLLGRQLPHMTPAEQAEWGERLERLIRNDPSPEYRAQAVRTIALIPSEASVRALNVASTDSSEKVRIIACQSWKQVGGAEATNMLLTMANNTSETTSVRQAAIESLSAFDEGEVRTALRELLGDRSPAVQYQVTQSLTRLTGRTYGGDIQAWRDYLDGAEVPPPERSWAEKLGTGFSIWR